MSLYEVVCRLIKEGLSFSITYGDVNDGVIVSVGNRAVHFMPDDFHKAAEWMYEAAFGKGCQA